MALQLPVLQAAILAALQKQSTPAGSLAAAQASLASDLAIAIDTYIKSAQIITPPGQLVVTVGSPATQTGATTTPSPAALIS
jgi:hypothetical protein